MGQLEDLQRNRIARMQHIEKGFCDDDNQDNVIKAHNVGDVHPKHPDWVWTQLPSGKYDWRVRRKGQAKSDSSSASKQENNNKSDEKHEHEYKIEDAEKYVDKSSVSSVEKKIAKFILGGKSEKEIKQAMLNANVDSSVVDNVYKLGRKLASEAADEAKRIYKKETAKKNSSDNLKENELKKIGFSKEVEGKEIWFEKKYNNHLLRIVQEEVGNNDWWIAKVDSEYVLDDNNKPVTFETPLEAAEEAIDFVDSQKDSEPDFTPKIPKEISSLTNRSDYKTFEAAYRRLGADIFKEKYPTAADFQKFLSDSPYRHPKTQEEEEMFLGRNYAGDYTYLYRKQPLSKTAQIANMKKYYEDKAVKAKKEYQEKKNADYWASSEGVKRKSEIEQELKEQSEIRKKSVSDAISDVQKLFGSNNNEYEIDVRLSDYGDYSLGIKIDNKSWDSLSLGVKRDFWNKNNFKVEFKQSAISYDFNNPDDVKMAQAMFHCGNVIAQNTNKIKDILIKHGATYASTKDKVDKLYEELDTNH